MATATKAKTYKPDTIVRLPYNEIKSGFNIRTSENVKKTQDLLADIKRNGVQEPLIINQDGVLVDGFRRFECLDTIFSEDGRTLEVLARVLKIDEKEIPEFQFRTGIRKNYNNEEKNKAIYQTALLNSELQDKEIADKYGVSRAAVFYVTKIIRASDKLRDLVTGGLVTQNAAKAIVDHYLGGSDVNTISPEQRKKIDDLVDKIKPAIEKDKEAKEGKPEGFKPWTVRGINAHLNGIGEPIIQTEKAEKKAKGAKLADLFDELLKGLSVKETADGKVEVNGSLPKDLFDLIKKTLEESKSGTVTDEGFFDEPDVNGSYWNVWSKYSKFDGVVFVQISSAKYATYDEHIDSILQWTNSPTQDDFGAKMVVLQKTEMNALIKEAVKTGINVLKLHRKKPEKGTTDPSKETVVPDQDALQTVTTTADEDTETDVDTDDTTLGLDLTSIGVGGLSDLSDEELAAQLEEMVNDYGEDED